MAGQDRLAADRLTFFASLEARPWAHDFYQVMRRVEGLYPGNARIGESRRPVDDVLRLGQQASLSFAPANVAALRHDGQGRPRVEVRFLGLFGPQGPMPTHLTAFVRSREYSSNDPTLARFADIFHHRQLSMFYRAWRQAQPTASRDRPAGDRFMTYVGAFIGEAGQGWRGRLAVGDEARRHFAGRLANAVRNADGLVDLLTAFFGVPFALRPFAARWIALPAGQWTRLGMAGAGLGTGAVLGRRVFDAQHHFELPIGPLSLAEFERFLPGGRNGHLLREWLRRYCEEAYGVTAVLVLRAAEVPAARLGGGTRLGWTSWLGRRDPAAGDAVDVRLPMSDPVQ